MTAMNNVQMAAMLATPEIVADPMWYPDSGATNHCTADVENLSNKVDYQGKEKIYMGNGAGLNIHSTGSILSVIIDTHFYTRIYFIYLILQKIF